MDAFLEDCRPGGESKEGSAETAALGGLAEPGGPGGAVRDAFGGLASFAVEDAGEPCDVYDLGGPPGAAFYGAGEIGAALSAYYDGGDGFGDDVNGGDVNGGDVYGGDYYRGGDDDDCGGWMHRGADDTPPGARHGGGAGGVDVLAWGAVGGVDVLAWGAVDDYSGYYSDYSDYSDSPDSGPGGPVAVGGGAGDAEWESRLAEMMAGVGADGDEY